MVVMRLIMIALAVLVTGCTELPQADKVSTVAKLAKAIAAEQDHVTALELADWIIKDQRDFELVDIRDQADYDSGHIRHARHIALAALVSDAALASLPKGRKIVVYSNGTAHAAQATILLRLLDRDAYALLGGFNYWQAYLRDPQSAGVVEMDPVKRARYGAVACFFEGDYVANAGLLPKGMTAPVEAQKAAAVADSLGLGLGLGSEEVREMQQQRPSDQPSSGEDPLGLGLGLGLGGESVREFNRDKPDVPSGSARKLLIKAEC